MSSIIFAIEPDRALVATDTLAVSVDGEPVRFTTKAFVLPRLQMIFAGTGAGGFLGHWFVAVNDYLIVQGIDDLDRLAPDRLSVLWKRYKNQVPDFPSNQTTTVYHFGFSERTGLIHAYAYRSSDGFRSSRIEPYGIGIKPVCPIPDNYSLPQDLRKMMDDQRSIQRALPKSERLYVGGEIEVHDLSKNGIVSYVLDRFEDYASDEMKIYDGVGR